MSRESATAVESFCCELAISRSIDAQTTIVPMSLSMVMGHLSENHHVKNKGGQKGTLYCILLQAETAGGPRSGSEKNSYNEGTEYEPCVMNVSTHVFCEGVMKMNTVAGDESRGQRRQ